MTTPVDPELMLVSIENDFSPEAQIPEDLLQTVEALLFAAHEPLPPSTLAPNLNGSSVATLDRITIEINYRLTRGGHPMRVRKVAGGYQMYVLPEFGPAIEAALVKTKLQRLSRAGLETLAIIAYKQPCSTPEIERIRGVSCGGVLSTLLERELVAIAGRSEGPGRPLLYGTTRKFLEYFGLNCLDDLPRVEELEKILAGRNPLGSSLDISDEDHEIAEDHDADHTVDDGTARLVLRRGPEPEEPSLFPTDPDGAQTTKVVSVDFDNGDGPQDDGETPIEEIVEHLDADA
jgi:segregation and condensation protein B